MVVANQKCVHCTLSHYVSIKRKRLHTTNLSKIIREILTNSSKVVYKIIWISLCFLPLDYRGCANNFLLCFRRKKNILKQKFSGQSPLTKHFVRLPFKVFLWKLYSINVYYAVYFLKGTVHEFFKTLQKSADTLK